jgi:hypothetical protein
MSMNEKKQRKAAIIVVGFMLRKKHITDQCYTFNNPVVWGHGLPLQSETETSDAVHIANLSRPTHVRGFFQQL